MIKYKFKINYNFLIGGSSSSLNNFNIESFFLNNKKKLKNLDFIDINNIFKNKKINFIRKKTDLMFFKNLLYQKNDLNNDQIYELINSLVIDGDYDYNNWDEYEIENELLIILLEKINFNINQDILNNLIEKSKNQKNIFCYIYLFSLKNNSDLDVGLSFKSILPTNINSSSSKSKNNNIDIDFVLNNYFVKESYHNLHNLIKHENLNEITLNIINRISSSNISEICLKYAIRYKNNALIDHFMNDINLKITEDNIIESIKANNIYITEILLNRYHSKNRHLDYINLLKNTDNVFMAKFLIDNKLYKQKDLTESLDYVIENNNFKMIEFLVENGADLFLNIDIFKENIILKSIHNHYIFYFLLDKLNEIEIKELIKISNKTEKNKIKIYLIDKNKFENFDMEDFPNNDDSDIDD